MCFHPVNLVEIADEEYTEAQKEGEMNDFVEMGNNKEGHFGKCGCRREAAVYNDSEPAEEFYT